MLEQTRVLRPYFCAGQCVAKFDHFCPIIATAVGDCNHCMFWCASKSHVLGVSGIFPLSSGSSAALASHHNISDTCFSPQQMSAWSILCRLYCVLQSFLILWGLALAVDALLPCLLGDSVSKASVSPMHLAKIG